MYDIIFISYCEPNAEENFSLLKDRFPIAKRVQGIKGIQQAHIEAARRSFTRMFWAVDGDAQILDTFNFDYSVNEYDIEMVHLWYSKNPINGLEYGYGGVKLFPRDILLSHNETHIDFTTSISEQLKIIPIVSNITCFNTDAFSTWRSAFRESVKLSSRIIKNQDDTETEERLKIWCTKAEGSFKDFSIAGAKEGIEFSKECINQPDLLKLINDFDWLKNRFNS